MYQIICMFLFTFIGVIIMAMNPDKTPAQHMIMFILFVGGGSIIGSAIETIRYRRFINKIKKGGEENDG